MAVGLRCPLVVGWLSRPDGHPALDAGSRTRYRLLALDAVIPHLMRDPTL